MNYKQENDISISVGGDLKAPKETISLSSISGMKKSIRQGLKTPLEKCGNELKW